MMEEQLQLYHSSVPETHSPLETETAEEGEAPSNGGGQFIINPELTELILSKLDFIRLKHCRLVCKEFNKEICRLFSNRGVLVRLFKELGIPTFKALYQRSLAITPALSSPFTNTSLRLSTTTGNIHDFYNLSLECPELKVTELIVSSLGEEAIPALPEYLKIIAPTLTKLFTAYWKCSPDSSSIHFPRLQKLSIAAKEPYAEKDNIFWRSVISLSPALVSLQLVGHGLAQKLLESCRLTGIRTLSIRRNCMDNLYISLDHVIETVHVTHLTKLSLDCDMGDLNICHRINATISRFSNTLISVKLWSNNKPWLPFPTCPFLSHLTLKTLDIESFNWANVPQLRSILANRIVVSYNETVEAAAACLSVQHVWLGSATEKISSKMFQLFPNATHWSLGQLNLLPKFCDVARACRAHVCRLGLVPSYFGDNVLQNVNLVACLKQLNELSELDIVSDLHCTLSPSCFPLIELPNIKFLRWQMSHAGIKGSANYTTLHENLASLQGVEIIRFPNPMWDADLEGLLAVLPSAVRIQKLIVNMFLPFV